MAAFSNHSSYEPTSHVTRPATCLLHCPSPHSASTKLLVLRLFPETWQKNRCKQSWGWGGGFQSSFSQNLSHCFPQKEERPRRVYGLVGVGPMWLGLGVHGKEQVSGGWAFLCFCPSKELLCSAIQGSSVSTEEGWGSRGNAHLWWTYYALDVFYLLF